MNRILGITLFIVSLSIKVLAYLYLIYKIWRTKSCAGISAKAHILYAVAYIARYSDVFTIPRYYVIYKSFEPVCLTLVCIILLSLFVFFKKTREPQYDTFRVELPIVCCIAMSVLINTHYISDNVPEDIWAFSLYLEAVAMLPQYHAMSQAQSVPAHVNHYLIGVITGQSLLLLYVPYVYFPWRYNKKLIMAGIVLQIIFYLNFLIRNSRYRLQIVKMKPAVTNIDDHKDPVQDPAKTNLEENISSIVLTPASLVNDFCDKANLLKDVEAK